MKIRVLFFLSLFLSLSFYFRLLFSSCSEGTFDNSLVNDEKKKKKRLFQGENGLERANSSRGSERGFQLFDAIPRFE